MGDHKAISINAPGRTQTYVFEAIPERFEQAQQQVRAFLEPVGCSMRTIFELDMVVEEVFINIAKVEIRHIKKQLVGQKKILLFQNSYSLIS